MQKAFIETQFPIARLSAESYKEPKGVSGQTLTGLGKWWGRKPLILVRGSILGILMPASEDPKQGRKGRPVNFVLEKGVEAEHRGAPVRRENGGARGAELFEGHKKNRPLFVRMDVINALTA